MPTTTRALLFAAALLVPLGAACSEDIDQAVNDARTAASDLQDRAQQEIDRAKEDLQAQTEDLRVNAVTAAVEAAAPARFSAEGYAIEGELTCEGTSPSLSVFTVSCTGTTTDGKPVTVEGERPEGGGGSIAGTVDGTEVFDSADCFGLC